MSVGSLTNRMCNVYGALITKNNLGAITHSYYTKYTNLPCRINYKSGQETVSNGNVLTTPTHRIYVPQATTIKESDVIVDVLTNDQYDVLNVNPYYSTHSQIECKKVTQIINFTNELVNNMVTDIGDFVEDA